MPQCHRPVNIPRICRRLLEIQSNQKEHFDPAHRAKDESSESARTSQIFPTETVQCKVEMVDRDSERNFGTRMLLHHQRPKWQEIQEKPSSFEATVS